MFEKLISGFKPFEGRGRATSAPSGTAEHTAHVFSVEAVSAPTGQQLVLQGGENHLTPCIHKAQIYR